MRTSLYTVYRAQFPFTFREINDDLKSDRKTVVPAVILLSALSILGASLLRNSSELFVCGVLLLGCRERGVAL